MRIAILFAAMLAASCAPNLVQSSSAGGLITLHGVMREQSKAAAIVNAECAKYDKAARITGNDILSDTITYECVAP